MNGEYMIAAALFAIAAELAKDPFSRAMLGINVFIMLLLGFGLGGVLDKAVTP